MTTVRVVGDKHGTLTGYNYGCRCDVCREAKRRWRLRRIARMAELPRQIPHGTANAYANLGCRCAGCRDAEMARLTKRPDGWRFR